MIACCDVVELAYDLIHGELDSDRHQRLEQHLKWCPSCVNFVRTYECIPNVSREVLRETMPLAMKCALKEFLQRELADAGKPGDAACCPVITESIPPKV